MDFVPGPDGDSDSRWLKEHRGFLLAWTGIVAFATVVVEQAFLESAAAGGLMLGIALFIVFALFWIAPER